MCIAVANPEGKPFERVFYLCKPEDIYISSNRHAEMGLVYLALTAPDFDGTGIELLDFSYDDCKYMYGEYMRMVQEGHPTVDKAAMFSWFKKPEAIARMRECNLDWTNADTGEPKPFEEIFQLVIDGGFATMANLDYYKAEVRKWRVVRAVKHVSYHIGELIDNAGNDFKPAIDYIATSLGRLQDLAATLDKRQAAEEA